MPNVFAVIGRFSVRFRWFVVLAWVAGAAACSALLPSLASVTQSNNTDFLPASAPSMHAAQLAEAFQPKDTAQIPVVVSRADGTLTGPDRTAITELSQRLSQDQNVIAVKDVGSSPSGSTEKLTIIAGNVSGPNPGKDVVDAARSSIAAAHLPQGLSAHLAGDLATNVDQEAQNGSTGNQVETLSEIFVIVLLLVIFRSLLAPLVTLLPAALVVATAGPIIAEAAHAGLKVSQLAQLMLIVLVIGAGTDYGLFLVFRVRELLRAGKEPKQAVIEAVTRVGESIAFSAGTVIAALLSLLAASFGVYSNLGVPLAIGIALMLLAGLTLLPALLAIFGRAVFWPSRARPGAKAAKGGVWGRVSGRIVQRPAVVLTIGIVVFGGLAVATFGYKSGGFGGATSAPAGSDSAAGNAILAQEFPRTSANPTQVVMVFPRSVWDDPAPAAAAEEQLDQANGVFTTVTGPFDPSGGTTLTPQQLTALHAQLGAPNRLSPTPPTGSTPSQATVYQAYRTTSSYISADGRTVLYNTGLVAGDPSTTAAMNAVPAIRDTVTHIASAVGATDSGVTGQAPGLYDVSHVSSGDLKTVIPIAIGVIGLLLALVMRSLIAPLYLIVSVGLSYLAALGLAVLVFIQLGGSSGLVFILPFLMFLFLLALGEDYNILVMTRIREECQHLPLRQAVVRALGATGTTVTSAGLVLAGTFAVFAIAGGSGSGGDQLRDVGTGLAIGILMDTFLVRTLLVPSTVVLLGRWNWWPSRMFRTPEPVAAPPVETVPTEPASTQPQT